MKDAVLGAVGLQAGVGRASRRRRSSLVWVFFWGGVGFWSLGFFLAHLRASPGNSEYSGHRRQRVGFAVSLLYVLIYSAAVS